MILDTASSQECPLVVARQSSHYGIQIVPPRRMKDRTPLFGREDDMNQDAMMRARHDVAPFVVPMNSRRRPSSTDPMIVTFVKRFRTGLCEK